MNLRQQQGQGTKLRMHNIMETVKSIYTAWGDGSSISKGWICTL